MMHMLTRGLQSLPPEVAHCCALGLVRWAPRSPYHAPKTVWGLRFPNPMGLAAGFDKSAQAIEGLARLGFGFIEVGTVTPRPQRGNPKPRLFRLPHAQGLINRMGFNNDGADVVAARIRRWRALGSSSTLLGINIGCNRDSTDKIADYARCAHKLGGLADYLVVNVSSPNTPGVRALQRTQELIALLEVVRGHLPQGHLSQGRPPPLLVKISPDIEPEDLPALVETVSAHGDGLIVANTTVQRPPSLDGAAAREAGGLSGAPLGAQALAMLRQVKALKPRLPVVACGGILSAADCTQRLAAGADLIQIYTGLVYQGPALLREVHTSCFTPKA